LDGTTPEGDRFEVLSTLIDAYEREHFPMPPPEPIEAIRFHMDQRGLKKSDLLVVFKTTARVSEVLGRKRRLSIGMIRGLHKQFSIPLECLINPYKLRSDQPRKRRQGSTK
jgi:HTH-type transcriptional regulator/antitoxin HigA